MIYQKTFKDKKILVTGHTGFKGSWLCLWLNFIGAKVYGISKNILTHPSHYKSINLQKKIDEYFFDLSDSKKTENTLKKIQPDFIFHLAAQAIVKKSYDDPLLTWKSNLISTLNILEFLKNYKKKCNVVIITSDKVYRNIEINRGYHENDLLGGDDPYSGSKGATELLLRSYIKSFFSKKKKNISLAIARAGNVIGGGDWSEGRLIPDCIKYWRNKKKVIIRNPNSTRPWQHVLEVLSGYLILSQKLASNRKKYHGESFNFGPSKNSRYTVLQILYLIKKNLKNISWIIQKKKVFKEAKLLKLNSKKANKLLNWKCSLNTNEVILMVIEWYKNFYSKEVKNLDFSTYQIKKYIKILKLRNR